MNDNKPNPPVYFVMVARIKKANEVEYHFKSFWTRLRWTLKQILERKQWADYGPKKPGFIEMIKFWFSEGWQKRFPVDCRTWGYYFNKEDAFRCVEENWTDIHEQWYAYASVEAVHQGIMNMIDEDEQWFWEWDREQEKYIKLDKPPKRLIDIFEKHSAYFSFYDNA